MFRLFSLFIFCSSGWASTIDVRASFAQSSGIAASATLEKSFELRDNLILGVAPRLSFFPLPLRRLDYATELTFTVCPYFDFSTRLHHALFLAPTAALSHLLPTARLHIGGFFFEIGWYLRLIRLKSALPIPYAADAVEHDVATRFGYKQRLSDLFALELSAGTIESVEVFNINNPYAELRGIHSYWFAFTRYKLLLGFGRWDEFTLGFGTEIF